MTSKSDPFDRVPGTEYKIPDMAHVRKWRDAFKKEGISLFDSEQKPYLPIEVFKWFPNRMPLGKPVRQFRSSGTTMKERSVSQFSHDGYELYRGVSLFTFYKVLSRFFSSPETVPGFSFVPPVSTWPESSLAQMVEWISTVSPVTYLDATHIDSMRKQTQPIWIFGTGFHFVELLDGEKKYPLPQGSLVIETGGTKGKTREISRAEYLDLLCSGFEIEPWQILSEYGMAELASQAYEWIESGQHHHERRMRLPWWVEVSCTDQEGSLREKGFGALCLLDRARIDIPLPIRTQDLVEISDDKTFVLKGRVPAAALKGCSLNAESNAAATTMPHPTKQPRCHTVNIAAASARLRDACERLVNFLNDETFQVFGVKQFGNKTLFEGFKQDLITGIDTARSHPEDVLKNALMDATSYVNWLFIVSGTHPQAAFYPCILGYALGFKMWLRTTSTADTVENRFFAFLKSLPEASVEILPSTFRVGMDALPQSVEAMFCFGSDDTIRQLKELSGLPIAGFGSHLTITCVSGESKDTFEKLAKDCLSLGQKGCMSTRLVIYTHEYEPKKAEEFCNSLSKACAPWVDKLLDPARDISLDHEWTEARLRKRALFAQRGLPLIHVYDEAHLAVPMQELFSERNFVIPVVFVSPDRCETFLNKMRSTLSDLGLMTTDNIIQLKGLETRGLGEGNQPAWDGRLEGRALFATDAEVERE